MATEWGGTLRDTSIERRGRLALVTDTLGGGVGFKGGVGINTP